MNRLLISLLMPAVLFLFTGCRNDPSLKLKDLNDKFVENFPLADMNTSLQLGLGGEENTFNENPRIPLFIFNRSLAKVNFG